MSLDSRVPEVRSAKRPLLVVEPDPDPVGRVALVPGSFDPITVAHAALAEAASAWADAIVLLYSVRTLAKEGEAPEPPLLAESDRIQSLEAFSRSGPKTVAGLSSHGLLVDQVRAAVDRFPSAELRLVIGSDKLIQLLDRKWYEDRDEALDVLFGRAAVMFAVREGDEAAVRAALADPANARWKARVLALDVDPTVAAVSSRMVRSLLRQGEDVRHLVPSIVARRFDKIPGEAMGLAEQPPSG
jgi:nicotinic acid mononucleotide adenylyltransferase